MRTKKQTTTILVIHQKPKNNFYQPLIWLASATLYLSAVDSAAAWVYTNTLMMGTVTSCLATACVYTVALFIWFKPLRKLRKYLGGKESVRIFFDKLRLVINKIEPQGNLRYVIRSAVVTLSLVCVNIYNLLSPWFSMFALIWVVLFQPFLQVLAPDVLRSYDRRVRIGEFWSPVWLIERETNISSATSDEDRVFRRIAQYHGRISRAAGNHGIQQLWLFGTVARESSGGFARLRLSDVSGRGGSELGLFQLQHKLCMDYGLRTSGWWKSYMNGTKTPVNASYLEYQRQKFLVFWCGFELPFVLDYLRYFLLTSIDDRLSSDSFDFAARMFALFDEKAILMGKTGLDARTEYVFSRWNNGSDLRKYIEWGEKYLSWSKKNLSGGRHVQ